MPTSLRSQRTKSGAAAPELQTQAVFTVPADELRLGKPSHGDWLQREQQTPAT